MTAKSLQETYGPHLGCFGCGPANKKGFQIRSFVDGDTVTADWQPQPHHEAVEGFMNAGVIGTLLDCHSNWAAAWFIRQHLGTDEIPSTVSAEYSVKLLRPISVEKPVKLVARAVKVSEKGATIEADMISDGRVGATCQGWFPVV